MGLLLWAVFLGLALGGCTPSQTTSPDERAVLELVPPANWPVLYDDLDSESLEKACMESLAYLERVPPDRIFSFGEHNRTAAEMISAINQLRDILLKEPDPKARTEALKENFLLFKSIGSDGKGRVLFTGYYEPVLKARVEPEKTFQYPLYAVPDDLLKLDLKDFGIQAGKRHLVARVSGNKVVPYYDREEIDFNGALEQKAEPLAYLADPVEAFFLHIQGSGQVVFKDGRRLRLGYAGVNGHPYRSIGKYLIEKDLMSLDNMSMQAIKAFLEQRPELRRDVFSHNPSYVFFRPLKPTDGPLGCFGKPLTAGRSIATDRRIFPGLAPAYIVGETPALGGKTAPMARIVLNQDTGGAIRGPGRVDLYYGSGDKAGSLAGRMKYPGELFFLAPRRK
jgi:membrane-bound lytic murein transglycosylase A